MKIAINALAFVQGGGITYIKNIITYLINADKDNEYYLFIADEHYADIFSSLSINTKAKVIRLKKHNLLVRIIEEQLLLPYWVWIFKIDLLFCPANILSFLAPCKKVLMIQSINPFIKREKEGIAQTARMRILCFLSLLSIKLASKVIFTSNYSADLVSEKMRIDKGKIETIYLGVADDYYLESKKDEIKESDFDYILSVSIVNGRKNYETLIRAYNDLKPEIQGQYKLVIVGDVSDEFRLHLLNLSKNNFIRDNIVLKGNLNLNELIPCYRNASLFVLPSLIESFALPPIEAMASGIPVIVANSTSFPEAGGQAVLKFNPQDTRDLVQKMEDVLSDTQLAKKMSLDGIERAKLFSWGKTAELTLKCFMSLQNGL